MFYCRVMSHKKEAKHIVADKDVVVENTVELEKMIQYIITILDNTHVASNCFEYPVLIKENADHDNLYLGYAVNANKFKALCFFESMAGEQSAHTVRNFTVNKKNAVTAIYRIRDIFGITSKEELSTLVDKALSNHKIELVEDTINEELLE